MLARARADSTSLLEEQERGIAESAEPPPPERSRASVDELGEGAAEGTAADRGALPCMERRLERAQNAVGDQIAQLAQRQKQLISEAEARHRRQTPNDSRPRASSSARASSGCATTSRGATQETVATGGRSVDTFATERRRALHELNERMRRRDDRWPS
jgi:hypothetical protein